MKVIMIVDDSAEDQYLAERYIERCGFDAKIQRKYNGEEASTFLKTCIANSSPIPNVVLLDINMPVMNGFQFLEEFSRLKDQHDEFNKISVLMYSSSDNTEDRERAFQFDCVKDYFIKPVSPQRLCDRLQNVFTSAN